MSAASTRLLSTSQTATSPRGLVTQTCLLLWKQQLVFRRNIKLLLFQVLTPLFICLFLVYLEHLAQVSLDHSEVNPPKHSLNRLEACTGPQCVGIGIGYTNGTRDWTNYVINHLETKQGLRRDKDFKVLSDEGPLAFLHYLEAHYNQTAVGILFCTGDFSLPENPLLTHINCSSTSDFDAYVYSIFINSTNVPNIFMTRVDDPMPMDHRVLQAKIAIDRAIFSYKAQLTGRMDISIEAITQDFPHTASRFVEGYDVIAIEGAFWFFIPPMVTFILLLTELVREKELRLRTGLAIMGMRPRAYWVSWFLTGLALSLASLHVLILAGYALHFDFFLKTPYLILVMLFGAFSLAMELLAFLLSTLITNLKTAYTISYAFLLLGLVLQLFMTNVYLLYLLYLDVIPSWISWVRFILPFYPPFNFSKAFGDISHSSSRQYSGRYHQWMESSGFTWGKLVRNIHGSFAGASYQVPSTLMSILTLVMDAGIFGVMGWYCDHVIAGNCSSGEPWYFPARGVYRCFCGRKKVTEVSSDSIEMRDMNEAESGPVAMRFTHLTKTFFKYPFGLTSNSDVTAVKDLSLDIGSSELFTLLGHNGAGKSTLISMLVGILAPSSGFGLVSGLDIEQDMQEIRRNLGYCPQHDILWEELTAMEHLLLFSQLKGRSRLQAATESKSKLTQVSLFDVKDALVGTFSGGMKRRLSVAIASIGDPAVMIMDEPTTGMDPLSKREVWELIKQLKRDRCILLTTHSMEEADILSDRIAIMTNGKLQCCGSSLRLKSSYGRGYRLSIISSSPTLIKAHLTKLVPETQVLSESAGSLILTVPQGDSVLKLLAELEGGSLGGVEDWSISHTTLEEVFMRVTGELIAL